ncbi:MAG TPA: histidine ammonia-lyase, partial [Candidatus Edwardsbacteria bacterium]|nr:histidine ammonia-lyase [Candidatus Edwardsbacteria bacterium]
CGNVRRVLACELLCAAQGLEFLKPLRPGKGVRAAYDAVRQRATAFTRDREFSPDIEAIASLIEDGGIVAAAEKAVGRLGPQ